MNIALDLISLIINFPSRMAYVRRDIKILSPRNFTYVEAFEEFMQNSSL